MSQDSPKGTSYEGGYLNLGIVAARYNQKYVDRLLENVLKTLHASMVDKLDLQTVRVPGSHEVPYAVGMLAGTGFFDCIIALGVLIAGDTQHHEIIANNTSEAFIRIGLETGVPVINGIIAAETPEQAEARCGEKINRGEEFAFAALEMASLSNQLAEQFGENHEEYNEEKKLRDIFLEEDRDSDQWKS